MDVTLILHIPESKVVCAHRPTFTTPEFTVGYHTFDHGSTTQSLRWLAKHLSGRVPDGVAPQQCWLWFTVPGHIDPGPEMAAAAKAMRGPVHPKL